MRFSQFNLANEGRAESGRRLLRTAGIDDEDQFLDLRKVNVARGDRVVLHDVNLSIRAGEHVAILGPNGCGKSTLILTMTCQIYPIVQPGMRVSIFGRERWDLTQLRKHFGVVRQACRFELPGERTAVTTGLDAVIAGFFSASTLWPNLHVDGRDARSARWRRWSGWRQRIWRSSLSARCRRGRSGGF